MHIQTLTEEAIPPIVAAFNRLGWNKPLSLYRRYLDEQAAGGRRVLVAWEADAFVGYLTVLWASHYVPFREAGIPEISDFNVLPAFRRGGIGSRLMDEAERLIATRSAIVGIGVGMTPDYGAAQRLYVRRGYVPDGRGLAYDGTPITYGQTLTADDSLVLYFTRRLRDE